MPKEKKKRRGHGEGSYFERVINGVKYTCKEITLPDGQRKVFYAKSKHDLHAKEGVFLRGEERKKNPGSMPLYEYLEYWMETAVRQSERAPATIESYGCVVRRIKDRLKNIPIGDIKPNSIQEMINKIKKDKTLRTAQYTRVVLSMALKQAVRWEMLDRNPVDMTDAVKVKQYEFIPFTREQLKIFLGLIKGEELEGLFTVAVTLGTRLGEMCGLRWKDISENILYIKQAVSRTKEGVHFKPPKSEKSKRQFKLTPPLIRILDEQRSAQEIRKSKSKDWQNNGLVFCTKNGTPYRGENVRRRFKQIVADYNEQAEENNLPPLPDIRLHDLRHTCASLAYQKTKDIKQVSDYLGHAQSSTTSNIYVHLYPEMKSQTVEIITNDLFDE
ncbi:MAG: tyrosine-type recombinase/integrase [bacterium]|jgi:integrase